MTGKTLSYYAALNSAGLKNNEVTRQLVAQKHGIQFPKVNPYRSVIEDVKTRLVVDGLSAKKTAMLTQKLNVFTKKAEIWENSKDKKIAALTARLDELVTSEVLKAGRLFQAGKLKDVPQTQPFKTNIGTIRPHYKKTDKKLQHAAPKPGTTGADAAKPKSTLGSVGLGKVG